MTEVQVRAKVVGIFEGWNGLNESNGGHKQIIDIYNASTPLPRGYKVKYSDKWCATAYSAAMIKAGYKSIAAIECSCAKLIEISQKMGIWQESDSYIPSPGDGILYDWDDGANFAKTDNKNAPEHIGMVVICNGSTIRVIEGNKSNSVAYRDVPVNGRYIRGFITPNFKSKATTQEESKNVTTLAKEVIAGKWGSGEARKQRLTAAGYKYEDVQAKVNELMKASNTTTTKKSNEAIAKEVIAGKWGNGADRTKKLKAAGYDPAAIQKIVNRLMKK